MTPQLTLYRVNGSVAMVAHILLEHLGIPFTSVVMRGRDSPTGPWEAVDGSLSVEQYMEQVHHMGLVPALKVVVAEGEDGAAGPTTAATTTVITETPAILTYIASLTPEGRLMLGRDPLERAKVLEWMIWLSGTLHGLGFRGFWKPSRFAGEGHGEDVYGLLRANGIAVAEHCFSRIEKQLSAGDGTVFCVGEGLTVVEVNLYAFWRWAKEYIFPNVESRFPRYTELAARVEGMEATKRALKTEGKEPHVQG